MCRAHRRAANRPKDEIRNRRCILRSSSGLAARSSRARAVLITATKSTTTRKSAEQFPREPATRARNLLFPCFLILLFRGPRGQYYSIGNESRGRSGQGMARLSAAAGVRAARMGGAQTKRSNDLTIRVGELYSFRLTLCFTFGKWAHWHKLVNGLPFALGGPFVRPARGDTIGIAT